LDGKGRRKGGREGGRDWREGGGRVQISRIGEKKKG